MSDDVLLTIRITSHPTVQSVLALMLNLSCAGLSLIQLLTFLVSDMLAFLLIQLLTHIFTLLATWLLDMSQT